MRVPFQALIPAAGLGTNANHVAGADVYRLEAPQNDEVLIIAVIEASSLSEIKDLLDPRVNLIHKWSTGGGRHIGIATYIYLPTAAELNQWRALIAGSNAFDLPKEKREGEQGSFDMRAQFELDPREGMCRVLEFGIREFAMWAAFTAQDEH